MPHWKEVEQVRNSTLYHSAEWQEHLKGVEEILYDSNLTHHERNDMTKEYIDSLGYNDAVNEAMLRDVVDTAKYQSFLDETGRQFGGGGLDNDEVKRDYDRYVARKAELDKLKNPENNDTVGNTEIIENSSNESNNNNSTQQNPIAKSSKSDTQIEKEILEKKAEGSDVFSLDGNSELVLPEYLPMTGTSMSANEGYGPEITAGIFSQLVYENKFEKWTNMPPGWYRSKYEANLGSYHAEIFVNSESKEVVIAHKGSDFNFSADALDDWLGINSNVFTSIIDGQHNQASIGLRVHDKVTELLAGTGYEIINVGHSLGGHIAEVIAAYRNETKAYSFDPLYSSVSKNSSNVWRYVPEGGVYELSQNEFKIGSLIKNLASTHNLTNILNTLSNELIENVYDNINPIANSIYEKSHSLNDIF